MKSTKTAAFVLLFSFAKSILGAEPVDRNTEVIVSQQAREVHNAGLLFDGHNDLPWAFRTAGRPAFSKLDIAKRQDQLHTDIPRLRKGGVKSQFWSVYVPASTRNSGEALLTTLEQIDFVHEMIDHYPETFELALTADDVQRIVKDGRIASLIGMEGGHSIENSLSVLRQLYSRGARYMTLTHSETLDWADSATDDQPHRGLTPFGERVVEEMNRIGMLVDLSHVSVQTMQDALQISKAPIIFSHSSARAIADHPRNVPDEILRLTAKNGGVVMVNYYPSFVVPESAERSVKYWEERKRLEKGGMDAAEVKKQMNSWEAARPLETGTIHDVVDHIVHIATVAGIDHVGIGSDYDGVDALPKQLEDVSTYPKITQLLLDRGYSANDIHKILGGNILRVMREAERVSQELSARR